MSRVPTLIAVVAAAVLAGSGLSLPATAESQSQSTVTPKSTSRMLFTFKDSRITESSGIETSVRHRRIVYTHNDSGDDARFFAVGRHGGTRAVYRLAGAGSWDWEDMSAGPNKTLWFGDIGANQLGRDFISVFKVHEPKRIHSRKIRWRQYDFVYADGQSHNAEALLVNPVSGRLLVVTKADSGAGVYRASRPLSTKHMNTLRRVADAPASVTGGAFSPDGKRLVLRNYSAAYFYKKVGGHANQVDLPSGGESIAFARYRAGVIVGKEGVHSPVWRVRRN